MLLEDPKTMAMYTIEKQRVSLKKPIKKSLAKSCTNDIMNKTDSFFADKHTYEGETPETLSEKHIDIGAFIVLYKLVHTGTAANSR